jgi:hypothetical protein
MNSAATHRLDGFGVGRPSRFSRIVGSAESYRGNTTGASPGARHYAVGGLVFFVKKVFAVDFRAGGGLNANANPFLIGAGFAFRR